MTSAALTASLMLGATGAHAQTLDRSKRPVAPPAPPFKFPKSQTQKLANGLRIIVIEDHALPLVTVRAVVDADSSRDPAGKEGLFNITSGMLREGTKTMSADQQAAAFAALGNSVTAFRFTTIPANVDPSLALMADMLENPSFPDEALTRRKGALAGITQRRLESLATVPNQLLLNRLLGEGDATARSYLAPAASISSITHDDVVKFYSTYFQPSTTTIIVAGDVQTPSAIAEIKKQFGGWTGLAAPAPRAPVAVVSHPTTIYLIDQPGAKQTQIAVGTLGPPHNSRDAAALDVMSYVLGNGSTSRISQNLREKHSYMYSGAALTMSWRRVPDVSIIGGLIPVNPAKSDSALIEWLSEMRGMRDHPPTPQEMSVAQGILVSTLSSQVETVDKIADRVTFLVQNDLPLTYYDGYVSQVMHVTPRDVSAVAAKYLDLSHLVVVVSGDRKMLQPMLEAAKLGAVVVVDK